MYYTNYLLCSKTPKKKTGAQVLFLSRDRFHPNEVKWLQSTLAASVIHVARAVMRCLDQRFVSKQIDLISGVVTNSN